MTTREPTIARRRRRVTAATALIGVVILLASSCVLNGTWVATSPAPVTDPVPADSQTFVSVSCPTTSFCMGVGNARNGVGYTNEPFVQTWDGATWTEVAFDPPEQDHPYSNELVAVAVSCSTATRCLFNWIWDVDDERIVVFSGWDGTAFSTLGFNDADVFEFSQSCAANGCVVVHNRATYTWTGGPTLVDEQAYDPSLVSISCAAIDDCVGVNRLSESHHWDGSTWTLLPAFPTDPAGTRTYDSISCTAASRCLAVGSRYVTATSTREPAAALWNGTVWASTPLPVSGPGRLRSVSCADPTACVAVGDATVGTPAVGKEVALAWNGDTWYSAVDPPQPAGARYAAISCTGDRCMAVGRQAPGGVQGLLATSYTWEASTP